MRNLDSGWVLAIIVLAWISGMFLMGLYTGCKHGFPDPKPEIDFHVVVSGMPPLVGGLCLPSPMISSAPQVSFEDVEEAFLYNITSQKRRGDIHDGTGFVNFPYELLGGILQVDPDSICETSIHGGNITSFSGMITGPITSIQADSTWYFVVYTASNEQPYALIFN